MVSPSERALWRRAGSLAPGRNGCRLSSTPPPLPPQQIGSFAKGWFSGKDSGFFLITIVPAGDSPRIASYLGSVSGEVIIGANIFLDMIASVRDVVGGRAGSYERALSGARDAAD